MAVIQIMGYSGGCGLQAETCYITKRFEAAGSWNAMMTHRVRISDRKQVGFAALMSKMERRENKHKRKKSLSFLLPRLSWREGEFL